MKKSLILLSCLVAFGLSACGGSSEEVGKGPNSEDRTTAFKSMMPNFSSMGKMVKGEEPYDVEKFKTAAAAFSEESKKPFEHFERDPAVDGKSQDGDALPAIWEKTAEFKADEDKFQAAVAELNTQAQSGNLEAIKVAYGNVGASCKTCHQSFRRPK